MEKTRTYTKDIEGLVKQYNEILEQAKKYDKVQSFTPALLYKMMEL